MGVYIAMARLPIPGQDSGTWGDILNQYLSQSHATDGTLKAGSVGSTQLQDNSVTNNAIAPNTITNAEIASDAVNATSIADGSIVNNLIADSTIQEVKLSAALQSKIDNPTVADTTSSVKGIIQLTGDLAGSASSPSIAKIQGIAVNASTPTDGQVLQYSTAGNEWTPATVTSTTVSDATATDKGIIQLTGDLGGTASSPTVPGLANKLDTATAATTYAPLADPTFTGTVTIPAPTNTTDAATKAYVDSQITGGATPDATASTKGKIQLSGDLSGSAASPSVVGLNGVSITGTPSSGNILTATSGSAATWSAAPSAPVTSVAGRTGAVTLAESDISNLTTDLAGKESTITAGTTSQYYRGDKSWQTLDKTAIGLGQVDNTSDATKNSATVTLTNKTLVDPVITTIKGTAGGTTVHITDYADSTSYLEIDAWGDGPGVYAAGSANDIDLWLGARGAGNVIFYDADSSGSVTLTARGDVGGDTDLNLSGENNGVVKVGGVPVVTTTQSQTLTNKTIDGSSNTFINVPYSAVANLTTDLSLRSQSFNLFV